MARPPLWTTIVATMALSACELWSQETVDGPYILDSIDITEDSALCYRLESGDCVGRVAQTVFAVGFNDRYVVAARHPHRFEDRNLDRSKTEYYYLIRARDGPLADPADSVRGPFDASAYERERERLGLPPFTREISALK
jgi:hypothetical protein